MIDDETSEAYLDEIADVIMDDSKNTAIVTYILKESGELHIAEAGDQTAMEASIKDYIAEVVRLQNGGRN